MRTPLLLWVWLLISASGAAAQPATATSPSAPTNQALDGRKNLFAFDIAGRGGIAAAVYEREVHPHVALGIGVGSGWGIEENEPGLVPLYLSSGLVGVKHRLHIGAGVSLVHVPESYRSYAV